MYLNRLFFTVPFSLSSLLLKYWYKGSTVSHLFMVLWIHLRVLWCNIFTLLAYPLPVNTACQTKIQAGLIEVNRKEWLWCVFWCIGGMVVWRYMDVHVCLVGDGKLCLKMFWVFESVSCHQSRTGISHSGPQKTIAVELCSTVYLNYCRSYYEYYSTVLWHKQAHFLAFRFVAWFANLYQQKKKKSNLCIGIINILLYPALCWVHISYLFWYINNCQLIYLYIFFFVNLIFVSYEL